MIFTRNFITLKGIRGIQKRRKNKSQLTIPLFVTGKPNRSPKRERRDMTHDLRTGSKNKKMQNKPNFPLSRPKNKVQTKKQTQTNPIYRTKNTRPNHHNQDTLYPRTLTTLRVQTQTNPIYRFTLHASRIYHSHLRTFRTLRTLQTTHEKMTNEPNFPPSRPKNNDPQQKRTQTNPITENFPHLRKHTPPGFV